MATSETGAVQQRHQDGPRWDLVIFDHDGVIVDSEPLAARAMSEVLAQHGYSLSPHDVDRRYRGMSLARTRAAFERETGSVLPAQFEREYMQRSAAIKAAELQAVPGVVAVLDRLEAGGIAYCMASSSQRSTIASALAVVGLTERFAGRWWGADDVVRTKPAPDLFLLAAKQMGAEPGRCVVIEDTPIGVAAGRAAGMSVLGYCASIPSEALGEADAVFERMEMLPRLLGL
ncbi:MAG TPA: HAD family phosphatase [Acidimicrobiales bacterium]|nr:HAD family phosphatase [Acidimicrobiales bacterium]